MTSDEPPVAGPPARHALWATVLAWSVLGTVIPGASYLLLAGAFQPWLVLLATAAASAFLLLACFLILLRSYRRRLGLPSRGGWAILPCIVLAVAVLLSPYRPLSDTEKRVCMRAVLVAIVAERSPSDASTAPALGILAREEGIRYAVRHRIEQAADADARSRDKSAGEPTKRMAKASKQLQQSCGYKRPPI